ncbi:MAG TPA: alpha-E domain-containing protein, partial [Acidobacteriaceae bacterium]|nr:alpha-E domain-containing protein [Acidobacteriaceae bacterium]
MLSRVADSLYWMARYLERAEHTTRLLDVNLSLMLDETASSSDHRWQRLLQSLGAPKRLKWEGNPYALAEALIFDLELKISVVCCITSARENARHVREQISTEQWQRLNSLYLDVIRPEHRKLLQAGSPEVSSEAPSNFLLQVMETIHQFQGTTDSTMSHGEGWLFIQVGRFLERASETAALLEAYHNDLWAQPERLAESNQF